MSPSGASSTLALRVAPGARRDDLAWEEGRGWKAHVAAPPTDGRANDRLCAFVARDVLGIAPSRVRVRAGASGRQKSLEIELTPEALAAALTAWRARREHA